MEKISIIVPVYNVEKYLKYCVNSILSQTYKNFEIILVDDGSTDSSGKMCDDFASKDNRIKVIHKKNGGLSSARNEALKIASGDYIGFIDSDDCIVPDFYEYLYNLMKKHNADIAQGYFLRIPDDDIESVNSIIEDENKKIDIIEKVLNNEEALDVLYGILEWPYVQEVVVWNKLYKRDVLNNIVFPEKKLHEDEFTTHKILYNIKKIVVSNKYIYGYMQTKNSIMRKEISLKRVEDNLEASLSAIEFFSKHLKDLEYKICLRYLENCIELSGKIMNEPGNEKNNKLNIIEEKFVDFYNLKIGIIRENVKNDLEKIVLDLIERAYKYTIVNHNIGNFWNELNSIIK